MSKRYPVVVEVGPNVTVWVTDHAYRRALERAIDLYELAHRIAVVPREALIAKRKKRRLRGADGLMCWAMPVLRGWRIITVWRTDSL